MPPNHPKGVGRFAPTPSGNLHHGSLLAAVASYLDAKNRQQEWLLRIENIDEPRTRTGSAEAICRTLESHHLYWDGEVTQQSTRKERYQNALDELINKKFSYPCVCSRKSLQSTARQGLDGPIYPGNCRSLLGRPYENLDRQYGWRINTSQQLIEFNDRRLGPQKYDFDTSLGDFIVKRADGYFAYHLAVTIDDADQGVTDIVRGQDLLHSTARQILLQQLLDLPTPRYLHLPLLVTPDGNKLSKSLEDGSLPNLDPFKSSTQNAPKAHIVNALVRLGQTLPERHQDATLDELLSFAVRHWQPSNVPTENIIVS